MSKEYNGWANYETWNVGLWVLNTESLYHMARRAIDYSHLVQNLAEIGVHETGDGVKYDDPELDENELDRMILDL